MKRMFLMLFAVMVTVVAMAQVEVTKFKFARDEPFGNFPGRKMLDTKFKNTSGKAFKYISFYYYAVNAVGDVISGNERGYIENGKEYVKPKGMQCTGPFESGKTYSQWASGVITIKQKDVKAFPYMIEIVYMGTNERVLISITKDNIKQYFPKLEWIEYNRYNNAL